MLRSFSLLAIAAGTLAAADSAPWPATPYRHVLIIAIDGFREADLEDPAIAGDIPNIRALQAQALTFTSASSPVPTDSFPCLLGIVTGANPRTTGVYYDDTYSRTLYPPGTTLNGSGTPSNPAGAEVPWTEAVSINSSFLSGIAANPNPVPPLLSAGYDATALGASKLPLQLNGSGPSATLTAYYPHQWLKVNTIFEVARAAGLRTAWCDKHPSYEILKGPSGAGLDDFFGPESEAKIVATPPSDRVGGTFTLVDGGANKASKSQGGSMGQDDLRVEAVLNQLHGRTAKGAAVVGNTVPAIFGLNFIAVNSASKYDTTAGFQPDNSLTTGSQLNAGCDTDGTVSANLHEAFAHTDASIGKIVAAMKATADGGGSLYDDTLIVVTAKHGNSPRIGKATVMPPDWFSTTASAQPASKYSAVITYPGSVAPLASIPVARETQDASAILWLADKTQTAAAVANLQTFAAANPGLIASIASGSGIPALGAGMGDPATDDRAPDIIVVLQPTVIVATSLKRAEHGGFSDDESHVPLIVAGALPGSARGATRPTPVSTTQIATTALAALGLDPLALGGARAEQTKALPEVLDQAPVAYPDVLLAQKDGKLVVPSTTLSRNDVDPDGDPLLVTGVSPTSSAGGTVALVDGKVVYTPPAGFTGYDTFTYTVRDGARVSAPEPQLEQLGWADVGHTIPLYRGGWGSSIAAVPGVAGEYYLLADRGPNGDTSGIPAGGAALSDPNAKIFADPAYDPEIAHLRWNADGSVTLLGTIPLKTAAGVGLTGLPNHLNGAGQPIIDVGYDTAGNALAPDPDGIDSEGLVALADGTFWISDEYGPYLLHVDAFGKTIERIDPFAANAQGHKLPAVLARRLTNKGMEGLTVTPDGSLLVGMMQSALVNDPVNDPIGNPYANDSTNTYGKNNKKNLFLRVVTYRLVAGGGDSVGQVHQYVYLLGDPTPAAAAASGNKQAVSELSALSSTDFLVDERDGNFASDPGGATKKSWRFTLTGATPIDDAGDAADGLKLGGQTVETVCYNKKGSDAAAALAAFGIVPLAKLPTPTVDLGLIAAAYDHDKIEGILAANGRVVYSNDDDFGLNGAAAKVITGSYPVGNLAASATPGQITDYGQMLEVDPTKLLADVGLVVVSVTVAGNTPPTISDIADQHTPKNKPTKAIAVTVGDAETPAASLTLSASSSDPTLVPVSGIAFGGSGVARTITVTPASNQTGTATITVTVTDGQGLTASDSFALNVGGNAGASAAVATGAGVGDGNANKCGMGGGAAAALIAALGLAGRRRRR